MFGTRQELERVQRNLKRAQELLDKAANEQQKALLLRYRMEQRKKGPQKIQPLEERSKEA